MRTQSEAIWGPPTAREQLAHGLRLQQQRLEAGKRLSRIQARETARARKQAWWAIWGFRIGLAFVGVCVVAGLALPGLVK